MPNPVQDALVKRLHELWSDPDPTTRPTLPNADMVYMPGEDGFFDFPVRVPKPPQYQPYPEVKGGHQLAVDLDSLLKLAPALQGRIKSVQSYPNDDVLEAIANDWKPKAPHFQGQDWPLLNLLGISNLLTRRVALNPSLNPKEIDFNPKNVLAHEATHLSGYPSEAEPTEVNTIMSTLRRRSGF